MSILPKCKRCGKRNSFREYYNTLCKCSCRYYNKNLYYFETTKYKVSISKRHNHYVIYNKIIWDWHHLNFSLPIDASEEDIDKLLILL